jgi:hypothetical protein
VTEDAGDRTDWPDPNSLPCDECGHVWFPGQRQHGYIVVDEAGGYEDAEVLCALCRHQRLLRPADW